MTEKAIICYGSLMASSMLSILSFLFSFVCILNNFLVASRNHGRVDAGNCEALPLRTQIVEFQDRILELINAVDSGVGFSPFLKIQF